MADYSHLSERFAYARTKQQSGDKPALLAFGWRVEGGKLYPGLLFVNEPVRSRRVTFELFEPKGDESPVKEAVKLGSVDVKLTEHYQPCGVGMAYTDLELEVLDERHC